MEAQSQDRSKQILPGETIAVLGGGQLGRMFVTAARTMGYQVVVFDPDRNSPAGSMANEHMVCGYEDTHALERLAQVARAVSCEFENVPAQALAWLEARNVVVAPGPRGVQTAQDRIREKRGVIEAGFEVAPFVAILESGEGLDQAENLRYPAILKSARLGYDGKGQLAVSEHSELQRAWESLGRVDCVLEQRLDLAREVSVIVVRGRDGDCRSYPCIENHHEKGILDLSRVPARISSSLAARARQAATELARHLDYVGVLTVEFFVDRQDRLYINEMAPRPHNSGHLSINASICSQFEQQLRSLCGLALGPCEWQGPAAMINLLGDLWQQEGFAPERVLEIPGVSLHLYGKREARPGRKMGHVTLVASTSDELDTKIEQVRQRLGMAS